MPTKLSVRQAEDGADDVPLAERIHGEPLLVRLLEGGHRTLLRRKQAKGKQISVDPDGDPEWIQRLVDRGFHHHVDFAPSVCSVEAVRHWIVRFAMEVAEQSTLLQTAKLWRKNIRNSGERLVEAALILTDELAEHGPKNPPAKPAGPASTEEAKQYLRSVRDWLDGQNNVAHPTQESLMHASSTPQHEAAPSIGREYRYLERPDGEVLTPSAIANNPELNITGSTLSKNFGQGKPLTKRILAGKAYAYSYKEVAALRHSMTSRDESRH